MDLRFATLLTITMTLVSVWLSGCASPAPGEPLNAPPPQVTSHCSINGLPCQSPELATSFDATAAAPFTWTFRFVGGDLKIHVSVHDAAFSGFHVDGADCQNGVGWSQVGSATTTLSCGDVGSGEQTLSFRPGGTASGTMKIFGASPA